jgi:pyruvate,orthophosphate dikinase
MAREDPWRAYDSYRRFLASYAEAAWSLNLEEYNLVDAAKARHGVDFKQDLPWEAMRDVAEASKQTIREHGFGAELDVILADPSRQIAGAVRAVLDSWERENVARYREIKGLCASWHTAVIVQEMALGNGVNPLVEPGMDETAASLTGVIARSVETIHGIRELAGEIKFSAAGDDLVSGVTASSSLRTMNDLRTLMPTLHRRLDHIAAALRRFMGNDQEIEFTVERGVLSVLQSRSAQTGADQPPDRFLDPGEPIARGLGVRGGAFRGLAAFDEDDLAELAGDELADREDVDGVVIVVENPTPEDIPLILSADGLLTARGGSTSHAAVAIHSVDDRNMYAVMSVEGLRVDAENHRAQIVSPAGEILGTIAKGDVVAINGTSGAVFLGSRVIDGRITATRAAPTREL